MFVKFSLPGDAFGCALQINKRSIYLVYRGKRNFYCHTIYLPRAAQKLRVYWRNKMRPYCALNPGVAILLADTFTERQVLRVAKALKPEDLAALAAMEVKRQSHVMWFDYQLLPVIGESKVADMLLISIPKQQLLDSCVMLNKLPIKIARIDVESNIVLRLVTLLQPQLDINSLVVWVEVDFDIIKLFFVAFGRVQCIRHRVVRNDFNLIQQEITDYLTLHKTLQLVVVYLSGRTYFLEEILQFMQQALSCVTFIPVLDCYQEDIWPARYNLAWGLLL